MIPPPIFKKSGLKKLAASIKKDSPDSLSSNESNYDIPTFLRKHAD